MSISLRLTIIFFIFVLTISVACNNAINSTFAKSRSNDDGFVNGNVIQICCAWGPELKVVSLLILLMVVTKILLMR